MYYKFMGENKIYTSFNVENQKNYSVGDSIRIIYDSLNPKMNSALDELKKEK